MARLLAWLGLNPAHLSALLRLRGRLAWRQIVREPGRIIAALPIALLLVPLVGAATVGSFVGYVRLPDPWPAHLLASVLVILWGIWLLAPVLLFSLNEGLDLTRLLVYPVTRRDLAVSFVLGTVFDFPTIFMVPLFGAILIAWGLSPALPLVVLALAVGYGHMVLTSQLIVTIAGGILRSRRFRDITLIIISLLGSSCWLLQNSVERLSDAIQVDPAQLADWRLWATLQWTPPGAVARVIERVHAGAWGESLLWLAYAGGLLVAIGWIWSRLLLRWLTGEGFLIRARPRREERPQTPSRGKRPRLAPAGLPADLWTLFTKELKSLWRIPQRRVGLIQAVLLPLFFGGFSLLQGDTADLESRWTVLVLPGFAFFLFWIGGQNMLGMEGPGLPSLLVTPVPRRRIFLAKGMALLLVHGSMIALLALLLALVTRQGLVPPALLTGLAVGLAVLGVSAVMSVFFPVAVNLEQTSRRGVRMAGGGCLTGLAVGLLSPALNGLASLPAVGLLVLAAVVDVSWAGWVAGALALAYGSLVFAAGTRWAGTLLSQREPEVIMATRLPEGDSRT